jgi:hypothetical protein
MGGRLKRCFPCSTSSAHNYDRMKQNEAMEAVRVRDACRRAHVMLHGTEHADLDEHCFAPHSPKKSPFSTNRIRPS